MAAKKPKKVRKAEKPEMVISAAVGARQLLDILEAGKVEIDKNKLRRFRKDLEDRGIRYPKVRFVARNAPFMRRTIPPV
jgi:hypothetical protein